MVSTTRSSRSRHPVFPPPSPSSSSSSSSPSPVDEALQIKSRSALPLSTQKQLLQDIEDSGGREEAFRLGFTTTIINLGRIIYGEPSSRLRTSVRNKFNHLKTLDNRNYLLLLSNYKVTPSRASVSFSPPEEPPQEPLLSPPSSPVAQHCQPLLSPPISPPVPQHRQSQASASANMFTPPRSKSSTPSKANMLAMRKTTPSKVLAGGM
jgi:hypothetical protein